MIEAPTSTRERIFLPHTYIASRASIPGRAERWCKLRDEKGWNIISTWHNPENFAPNGNMRALWVQIQREVAACEVLILYVEANDLPLKGAFVECGMALACGKPVIVSYENPPRATSGDINGEVLRQHLGSWVLHPNVIIADSLNTALFLSTRIDYAALKATSC